MRVFFLALILAATGCSSTPPASDTPVDGCDSPLGPIAEGHTKTGYRQPVASGGSNCEQGQISCQNGQWTGVYIFPSCTRQP